MSDIPQKESSTTTNSPPCVRCGYCCSVGVCVYGDEGDNGECVYLEVHDKEMGTYTCTIRDEIIESEGKTAYPMFDNYCSSSMFNEVRAEVIRKKNESGHNGN